MYTIYVGICKHDTNFFKMNKFVNLAEMYDFVRFQKVGPIGTSISCLNCRIDIFISPHSSHTTTHNHHPTLSLTRHTPQNTLRNFPQLRTPPTFGDKDDDGKANLNAPGEPWMSVNVAVQPLMSPDWRRWPEKQRRDSTGRRRWGGGSAAAVTALLAPWARTRQGGSGRCYS